MICNHTFIYKIRNCIVSRGAMLPVTNTGNNSNKQNVTKFTQNNATGKNVRNLTSTIAKTVVTPFLNFHSVAFCVVRWVLPRNYH